MSESIITKKNTKRRLKNESEWKANKRKQLRQSGKTYVNSKGEQARAKECNVRKHCNGKSIFKCTAKISRERQSVIFQHFWELTDA